MRVHPGLIPVRKAAIGPSGTTNNTNAHDRAADPSTVAHIGLTEHEAHSAGMEFQVAKIPMVSVLRTRTLSDTEGFMKALVSRTDGRVLGFTMVGAEAGEVMSIVQTAMQAGVPYTFLRDSIFAHPTMAEGLNVLFSSLLRGDAAAP